ncbi:hypothetical protein OSCT_0329 [Oscillochloris trichoides DG-6]|uniref:Uncharacterized protein n=1 Tax=Oscillochloris trichoides DG-6 TaxID=765420 RepID=E1IAH8_9CHLR|nr:hypothetical protein OSCT_0329 [Oscillochloris trichoides DG-6]
MIGECFNPPGGFGAFGTLGLCPIRPALRLFQSAGRIWGFWNARYRAAPRSCHPSFNPPGGFGAFGTAWSLRRIDLLLFQSAGRIWGFWNLGLGRPGRHEVVSIRRADLGLLELIYEDGAWQIDEFQSAGRIWGFWNNRCIVPSMNLQYSSVSIRRADLGLLEPSARGLAPQEVARFNPPGGFGAFGTTLACLNEEEYGDAVSIRRADLGLLEQSSNLEAASAVTVSIRRADLGLLEPPSPSASTTASSWFQSAGRIWGFWNSYRCGHSTTSPQVSIRRADLGLLELLLKRHLIWQLGFNPPGGFGAFGTDYDDDCDDVISHASFNPPGGFGAFGTRVGVVSRPQSHRFQSAGRIWGFWNRGYSTSPNPPRAFQSAGRIWGFWNPIYDSNGPTGAYQFQSAGRIWGFWNGFGNSPGLPMMPVSIRRADLGLLELVFYARSLTTWVRVSIRRADLGLLEPKVYRP